MSDTVGRAALTIGGAFFFGPVGAIVGGVLGDLLFPVEAGKGPRLSELNVQHSTVGAPIPIVYGTAALAGNVNWSGGLLESQHEGESAGKGGPSGPTTYTYSVDVAVGICEGPIIGLRRLWADADLLYDASSDEVLTERLGNPANVAELIAGIRAMSAQTAAHFTLYLGTEDQLPDPTIESYEDAGTVPGFRGLAYIVFNDFDLTPFGNRVPNFRFEVYTGTPTECGLYSAGNLEPWAFQSNASVLDPRNELNSHLYSTGSSATLKDFDEALEDLETAIGRDFQVGPLPGVGDSLYVHGWGVSGVGGGVRPCGTTAIADYVRVYMALNPLHNVDRYCPGEFPNPHDCDDVLAVLGLDNVGMVDGVAIVRKDHATTPSSDFFEGYGHDSTSNCAGDDRLVTLGMQEFYVARTLLPPDPCLFGTALAGAPGYCVVGGEIVQGITWTEVSGTFHVLQKYRVGTGGSSNLVLDYPVNPCLISTDANYNNQAYWEAAYADALAAGEPIAPGLVYGVDYPDTQTTAYFSECATVDTACVPMAIIVADICRRAGLRTDTSTQIDVSGLTTCVNGYIIGRQMSARDALGPLRMFGLWDAVESGAILRFVERGAAIVETLIADDLGAHENGSQAPTAVEVSRVQEKDLPRRVRLHFADFLHDHEPSEQSASRLATEAIDEIDVELPISMEPDTAAQLADIMLYAQWVGRSTYRLALDNNRLALEPTDCIEIPVDGQTERVRIVAVNYKIGGILEIDAQRDDDGSYVSTATGDPAAPSGGVPGSHGNGPVCPSEAVLLDIPRLRDQDTDAGYYAAIYGLCPETWSCAELYRSNDGGATFGRVARTDRQATVGTIDDITGPPTDVALLGDSPQYDESNSITVSLFYGTLASVTDAQIDAGFNAAAIGVDGRWVIVQYKTATLSTENTWVLTDLIWGLKDTRHLLGTTVAGDTFVWLNDPALLRIAETPENIGVEKQFKVATCGESLDAVDEFSFTTWGLSYLRLCPSTVLSCSLTSPPTGAVEGDAYYLPNDTSLAGLWTEHGGEIATWSDETDSWVYCTPAAGTIVHCSDADEDVIPPGGGGDPTPAPWQRTIDWQDEGISLGAADTVNFVGPGVLAALDTDGTLVVAITGGGDTSDTSGPVYATPDATYLTEQDETADLPNSLRLIPGIGISFDTDTSGNTLEINRDAGIGGGMEFVAGTTVAGSAATTITVSSLDLDTDGIYYIVFATKNATASAPSLSLFYSGDTTAANYWEAIQSNGAATPGNDAFIGSLFGSTSSQVVSHGIITRAVPTGRVHAALTTALGHANTTFMRAQNVSHHWSQAGNVTSITVSSSIASTLAIGSSLKVWRINQ